MAIPCRTPYRQFSSLPNGVARRLLPPELFDGSQGAQSLRVVTAVYEGGKDTFFPSSSRQATLTHQLDAAAPERLLASSLRTVDGA